MTTLRTNDYANLREPAGSLLLDLGNLNRYLSKYVEVFSKTNDKITEIKQFKYGQSNPTYLLHLSLVNATNICLVIINPSFIPIIGRQVSFEKITTRKNLTWSSSSRARG